MSEQPDEAVTFTNATVTCHTEECTNGEQAIALPVPDDPWPPVVVCGVCGQPITDIN